MTELPPILGVQAPSSEFLLIRMDLASEGDCEQFLRKVEIQKDSLLCILFQIVLSLYIANEGVLDSRGNND